MTPEPNIEVNITEKLLIVGINFIRVRAITPVKFLLLFSDREAFDNFDPPSVDSIFSTISRTQVDDIVTTRVARLTILGLPILA